jgi:aldehyde dehydrogenase (NAD+)
MSTSEPGTEVRRIFDAQVANRWTMATSTAAQRIERLTRLRAAMRERRLELLEAIHADFGKQAVEAELTELIPVIEELTLAIHQLRRWMKPRRVGTPLLLAGSRSEVRYEPKGVVLVLAPWNYPFVLALSPVVAALAAGNTVMLRPSEKTPRTARFIRDLLGRVFPENEVAVLVGGRAVADALLELPFDHILFTGSPKVGRKVMAAAARNLTPVTLELGGKSPAIVDETADIDTAAERLGWAKFINAGQTCIAPDYVLVHETVAPRFEAALRAVVERFYGADEETRLRSPDLASLVDSAAAERLDRAVRETVARGARVVMGGRVDVAARRMSPTVLAGVPVDSAIMAEAIRLVQGRQKPLALYVFSGSDRRVEEVLRSTSAGGSCVNNAVLHFANPYLPFGGVGESGMGNYHGRWGFEAMSHARAVLRQTFWASTRLLFPPYTARVARLLSLLRRIVG